MASEWPRLGDIEYGDCEIGTGPLFRFAVVDSPDVLFVTGRQARDLRTAITAALGDGALVVTQRTLQAALEQLLAGEAVAGAALATALWESFSGSEPSQVFVPEIVASRDRLRQVLAGELLNKARFSTEAGYRAARKRIDSWADGIIGRLIAPESND